MNSSQTAMREKPIFPLLLSMSIPVMLSMLIQSLYNIIDGIWVTRLGTDALTAVSLAFPLQNLIMSAGVGMGIGIGSVVSLSLGANDREQASRAASLGTALVLIHCVVFFLLGLFGTRPFLQLFAKAPQTLEWACDYARIVLCLSFGELLQMCFEKIYQGAGKMVTTMFLMASGCLINIVLDPILIFGWFGFPALGVRGAALATVIGQVVAMLLYVVVYLRRDPGLTIHPRYARFDRALAGRIYGVGSPSTLMLAMPSLLTGLLNGILVRLGSVYVAVFGLYFKLQTVINMPSNGVVQGMRPILGYNFGAGETRRVRETIRCSLGLVFVIMLAGTVAAVGFPSAVLRLFDADAELMAAGVPALRIIGLSFLFSTVAIVACGVFEALGRGKESLLLSLLRQLILLVPVGFLLSRKLGAVGIWLAFPIAEAISLVVALVQLKQIRDNDL